MHSLRHACASLWIDSGYNPKQIHASVLSATVSIKVTFDVYKAPFRPTPAPTKEKAAENVRGKALLECEGNAY